MGTQISTFKESQNRRKGLPERRETGELGKLPICDFLAGSSNGGGKLATMEAICNAPLNVVAEITTIIIIKKKN